MPKVTVTFDKVNAAEDEIAEYIHTNLASMGGCRHPSDPLFYSLRITEISFHRGGTYVIGPRKTKQETT